MREILFRGKRLDNGEWVEGSFIKGDVWTDDAIYNPEWEYEISIDIETVGEFTGLLDKNGTKIFEGDIIDSVIGLAAVEWVDDGAGFSACGKDFEGWSSSDFIPSETESVVGNIHDNPELLKS